MARTALPKPAAAASPVDHDHQNRKRVGKACDRCRLKKSKCNGISPCLRCQQDNAICVFGERKRAHDKQYPKGYVEMLEGQQQQLVTGLQELYKIASSGGWTTAPLELGANGHPLTHDILESLGLLKHSDNEHEFEEDFDTMQQRLIRNGAEVMQHHHSDDEDGSSSHTHSPPAMRHSISISSPRAMPNRLSSPNSSSNSHNSFSSSDFDSPPTPNTPEFSFQNSLADNSGNTQNAANIATFHAMRLAQQQHQQQVQQPQHRQSWPQQMLPVSGAVDPAALTSFNGDGMDYLYKSSLAYQPNMGFDGLFDDSMMGLQSTLMPMQSEMDLDLFLQS